MSTPESREGTVVRRKDRTWATALAVFGVAFFFGMVCFSRDYALWKAGLRELFLLQNEETDHALEVLNSTEAYRNFVLGSAILLGLIPVLVQKLPGRTWVALLIVLVLYLPGLRYGNQVMRIHGKLMDWNPIFEAMKRETGESGAQPR